MTWTAEHAASMSQPNKYRLSVTKFESIDKVLKMK